MPYIKKEDKEKFEIGPEGATAGIYFEAVNAGELNYSITKLIDDYFERNGSRYQQINDIMGALQGASLEFYRRIAAPYEDKKILENGDVYPNRS